MVKQLKKVGKNSVIALDKALMELVGLEADGKVLVIVNNGSIILTPVNPRSADPAKFQACLDQIMKERRGVFARLAQR